MYNPFSLKGKTILITGASSGIGRATAIECAKLGATIILNGRNTNALFETLSLMSQNSLHQIIPGDLTEESTIKDIVSNLPLLNGCVLNAGKSKMLPLQFYTEESLNDVFQLNCFSPMLFLKHLVKNKKLAKPSSVVFTASISGYTNTAVANGMYGASKSALTAYMKYAALELATKGIRCNAVHPGRINTPLINNSLLSQEDINKDIEKYPLGRYGEPQEVAYAIAYLLSDASAWVTGSDLLIDGGRSLK